MSRRFMAALSAAIVVFAADTAAIAQTCPKTVLPNNNSTSGNARCPMARYRFARVVYLITATEMANAGYTAGASPTTIGWNYNANNGGGTGPLIVYMENTSDATNTKSTDFATAISTMTAVHNDANTTLPATAGAFDITMTGGSPFTYTGGGLYIAFDWGQYTGTLATTTSAWCSTTLTAGLLGAQSNTAAPTLLGASNFRPETRLNGVSLLNDAAVTQVYAIGELPFCAVPAKVIGAVVTNNGEDTLTNLQVTLNVTGTDTFTDMQTIPSLAGCGGQAVVTFASYAPGAIGSNTIAVSVPADTVTSNDSLSRMSDNTQNAYSYKYPGSTDSGGVGFNGASGAVVAKFTTTVPDTITDVNIWFRSATATTYRVAIYGDNAGVPSTTALYVDAADRTVTTAGLNTITLPSPLAVGPGDFYIGIHQTNTTNASLSFDTESPLRTGSFFFAGALPPAAWTDLGPGSPFKLNIGYLGTACAGQPCPADIAGGDNQVDVNDLLAVINAWGNCPAPCPPSCAADIDPDGGDCIVDVNDMLDVINAWGPCP